MTLLLGPPSSGKTTLLLALAGKLGQDLKSSGSVTYNGHDMHEFVPQRRAAYISQHDVHIGELTVKETLAFSARCQGVGPRYEMIAELTRREKEANIKPDPDVDVYMKAISTEGQKETLVTDYILKILGLDACADTLVGDQLLRGISGGQKKRVTTGEMLVGPARALFMDEISTGLDSSTTYQIVNSVKNYVHILNGTAVVSLLQPAPETYELFDDIILLSDGQIVYQGPREQVLDFFESMGFKCPERKGVADFLQEVTSRKDQKQYWTSRDEPYRFITVKHFSEAFQSFSVGKRITEELAAPFDKTKSDPAALTTKKYGIRKVELLKACFSRELLLMKRNSFVYVFKLTQLAIMALITMTVFLRIDMGRDSVTDGGIYAGALFYSFVTVMFSGMSEISMTIAKLPVFYKQRDLFFPSWAYALPTWILKIPITFLDVSVWVFITYYVIGFDPCVERFFRQYLLFLLISQMASALNRSIAGLGRSMVVAYTFGSFAQLMLFALGGFVLSREVIDISFSCKAIGEVDLNKSEPWDLPGKAKMGEKEWYFFCVRDRKYPTGLRTNRATEAGYWKATGKDKEIYKGKSLVGMKKTLVFYRGRAPKGEKSNWVMHEYRLEGKFSVHNLPKTAKNEWVICRVFEKNSGGKKTHISGFVRYGALGNEMDPSGLPPLMDSSPYSSKTKLASESSYVPCFSNPDPTDVQRNQGIVDYMNNPLFGVSSNTSNFFPRAPFSTSFYSAQSAPVAANFQFPGSVLMQDQSILRALLENNGSNMRQSFKTEREMVSVSQETGLTSEMNTEISSVMSNLEMGRRPFGDQEAPAAAAGAVDLDNFWNY